MMNTLFYLIKYWDRENLKEIYYAEKFFIFWFFDKYAEKLFI